MNHFDLSIDTFELLPSTWSLLADLKPDCPSQYFGLLAQTDPVKRLYRRFCWIYGVLSGQLRAAYAPAVALSILPVDEIAEAVETCG